MSKLAIFVAWAAVLFSVNKFILADGWPEYAFTFASSLLMFILLAKASRARGKSISA
ncbi:hypothetical protein SAMN05446589_4650 [Streptomyces sp. OV198]|jgi:hypothetical protein|nr:hypothetical protein BX281_6097 [Streptomyces sp. Ag82_O1-15]SOE72984.1 hypothetical protein SAMN05446589_4650 [Streptomyces sp. OV198]